MNFVAADGTMLSVDAAGDGPTVVFQHGLCGDAGQTAEAFPPDAGFRRVTIEARGHGRSQLGPLDRLSIATFADDIAAWIEVSGVAPVVIGGISMGAAIALRLAVRRPDLVRGLILARPAWITQSAPANMAPNAEVGRLLRDLPPQEARAVFLAGETGRRLAAEAPDNLASLSGFFSRQPVSATSALLRAISDDGPGVTEDDIRSLPMPALVIGHGRDSVHPLDYARRLASMIPKARLAEIMPKTENRERYVAGFRDAMRQFLKEFQNNGQCC